MAGMIAADRPARGQPSRPLGIHAQAAVILDVRDPSEYKRGHVDRALHIPVNELRNRLDELPGDRDIEAYCLAGARSYIASRILSQHGFSVKNISGGYQSYLRYKTATRSKPEQSS